jgi:MSHA biogenesis protein MshE
MGITTVDEVLKLIEMVADERAITQADSAATIEQELAKVVDQQNTIQTPSDEQPKSAGLSFELERNDPPLGGNGGTI